jgi:hypothetical protein
MRSEIAFAPEQPGRAPPPLPRCCTPLVGLESEGRKQIDQSAVLLTLVFLYRCAVNDGRKRDRRTKINPVFFTYHGLTTITTSSRIISRDCPIVCSCKRFQANYIYT